MFLQESVIVAPVQREHMSTCLLGFVSFLLIRSDNMSNNVLIFFLLFFLNNNYYLMFSFFFIPLLRKCLETSCFLDT